VWKSWAKVVPLRGKISQSCSIVWKSEVKVCRCVRYGSLARPAAPAAIELAFAHRPSGSGSALVYFPLRGKIVPRFSTVWKKDFVRGQSWVTWAG
jgi:hypothetical protein